MSKKTGLAHATGMALGACNAGVLIGISGLGTEEAAFTVTAVAFGTFGVLAAIDPTPSEGDLRG